MFKPTLLFILLFSFSSDIATSQSREILISKIYSIGLAEPIIEYRGGEWNYFECEPYEKCNFELQDSLWSFYPNIGRISEIEVVGEIFQREFGYSENQKMVYPIKYSPELLNEDYKSKIGLSSSTEIELTPFQKIDLENDSTAIDKKVIDKIFEVTENNFYDFKKRISSDSTLSKYFRVKVVPDSFQKNNFYISSLYQTRDSLDDTYYFHYESLIDFGGNFCLVNYGFMVYDVEGQLSQIFQSSKPNSCYERKTTNGFSAGAVLKIEGNNFILGYITYWDGNSPTIITIDNYTLTYLLGDPYFGY